jgi:hypothetical protein
MAKLVGVGSFDAMEELARVFPVEAFADEVGVPEEGRGNLLPYGDMVFNDQGLRNEYFLTAMQNAAEVQEWIMASCRRENLAPGGFGDQIYEAADAGEITKAQAGMLVRSFLSAGLDTTASSLGNAVHLFATNPEQWDLLRADPSLARPPLRRPYASKPRSGLLADRDPRHRDQGHRDREGRSGDDLLRGGQSRPAPLGRPGPVRRDAQGVGATGLRAWDPRVRGQARGPHRGRGGARGARAQGGAHRA